MHKKNVPLVHLSLFRKPKSKVQLQLIPQKPISNLYSHSSRLASCTPTASLDFTLSPNTSYVLYKKSPVRKPTSFSPCDSHFQSTVLTDCVSSVMASYTQSSITKPSNLSKYLRVCLGFMLLLAVVFFGVSRIFSTSTFLILCAAYFTLFYSQTPKHCKPNHKKEEKEEEVPEHVAHIVDDDYKDDQCITSNDEHEEDHGSGLVAKSVFLFKEDDYISDDEDTLIEIELPTGHYLSPYEDHLEQQKLNFNQKSVAEYYYCKKHHQHSWMELLSEEDDLIEIDISIGSIMCPKFEIEAPLVF